MQIGFGGGVIRWPGDSRPLPELYREAVDAAVAAEDKGYDFITVHERHFQHKEWSHSPLVMLAAIASRTTTISLGTSVLVGPFYHPVQLAEDVATLDVISGGRLRVLAIGCGSGVREFELYSVPISERFERTLELMRFLRKAFGGSHDVRYDGRFFSIEGAHFWTQPTLNPFPLWLAAFGPRMLYQAGLEGYNVMNSLETNWHFAEYLRGLGDGGHDLQAVDIAISAGEPVLAATAKEAEELRSLATRQKLADVAGYLRRRDYGQEFEAVWDGWSGQSISPDLRGGLIGTPDQVLEMLEGELKQSCVSHFKVGMARTGGPASEQLFLDEVVPVIRGWGQSPRSETRFQSFPQGQRSE